MYRRSLFSALFLLFIAAQAFAQDSLNVRMTGRILHYWDESQGIAVQGDNAYLATGSSGFSIVDISDVENPVEIGSFDTPASARGVTVSGQYAYVAASESGMIILDCSDPENPFEVSVYDTPGCANNVKIVGDSAYVSDFQGGLRIVDISDPENPVETAFCASSDSTYDVAISGRYAFMADTYRGIKVVNIDNTEEVFDFDFPYYVRNAMGIDIEGDYAYIACAFHGISAYDISDPENVELTDVISYYYMERGVDVVGDYAYITEGMWGGGLTSVNVSDPENIFQVSLFNRAGYGRALTVSGDYAYLAGNHYGILTVDISDPENPVEAGLYNLQGMIKDVAVMDQYALVMDNLEHFYIIDISEQDHPEIINTIRISPSVHRFFICNQYVFIARGEYGFSIYDLSDPEHPEWIPYGCNTPGTTRAIAFSGDYAFIADGPSGLQVADISDLFHPFIIASNEAPENAVDIAISGNHAFIADRNLGLRSFDISDPEDPQEISFYPMPGITDRLKIDGDIAYLTRNTRGISILNISDPANPSEFPRFDTPGVAVDIDIVGNNLFIADDQEGIRIIDVTYPNFPYVTGYYTTSGSVNAVAANDDIVIVSDTYFLKIFDYSGVHRVHPLRSLNIPLNGNCYEMISTPLVPYSLESELFFSEVENLVIAYQDDGTHYLPRFVHNSLDEIDITEGYQVYCDQPSSLPLVGNPIDPQTEYSLADDQWNWLGYPFFEEVPMEMALQEIRDQVDILMNDEGKLWIPARDINTLGTMKPGEGYYVAVLEDVTFRYHSDAMLAATQQPDVWEIPEVEGAPASSGLPYVVLVNLGEQPLVRDPSVIEIYDSDLLVGKAAVLEDRELTPVPCWQGSPEHDLQGFTPGHSMTVRAIAGDGTVLAEQKGGSFGEGAYAEINLSELNNTSELPREFTVGDAYPNPFNPSVTIPFALPQAGGVTFKLFNVLGQRVFSRTQAFQAGRHSFVFDATDDSGGTGTAGSGIHNDLVSSVYFLRVEFEGRVSTQKLVLLR